MRTYRVVTTLQLVQFVDDVESEDMAIAVSRDIGYDFGDVESIIEETATVWDDTEEEDDE